MSCAESQRTVWPGESGDYSLVRRFCSPKVPKSEIKGSLFRRFYSPKVRKSDNKIDKFLVRRSCSPKAI